MTSDERKAALEADLDKIIDELCLVTEDSEKSHVNFLLTKLDLMHIILTKELWLITDEKEILAALEPFIAKGEKQVLQYQAGNEKVWGYFFGNVRRALCDRVDPDALTAILKRELMAAKFEAKV